jgi:hypothetical protein
MQKNSFTVPFRWLVTGMCMAVSLSLVSCSESSNPGSANSQSQASPEAAPKPSQVEKAKPAAGKGNVQGQVLYNSKPAANIEVKLCETFSRFAGGCSGKTYTAKTDKDGYYVVSDVPPGKYQAILARVFNTNSFVFATTGIAGLDVVEYDVTADKTLFVDTTSLFKGDLKLLKPAAGAKVNGQNLELSWNAYPDAAYYKLNVYPQETGSSIDNYINERVDGTTFTIDKSLTKGTYRWTVEAYNSNDQKLSESGNDIKFTIK